MPVELPAANIYREEDGTSFELYVDDFKASGLTPTHLVFLIHGIGYKMYEVTKFQENIFTLSTTLQDVLFTSYADSGMRIYYLPITWAEEFHALTSVDGRMNKITLPTIPGMRVITNDCLSDVLYYFTDFHRQQLLDIICAKMNKAFAEFKVAYPDFDGNVGILSHSLGGVISYDLMTVKNQECDSNDEPKDKLYEVAFPRTNYPKLDFAPSFLFTLGSPVGAVMVMRGLQYEHFRLSEDTQFMNIFNPYDPLAYRIEPLIGKEYEELDPVAIPIFEAKESSSYLPNFTALLPERPNIMRAARNMLANLNLMDSDVPEGDSSSRASSEEKEEKEQVVECIRDLKLVDDDDMSTRRLSGYHATAVGLSSFKRGSVVERLHELNHKSSSTSLASASLRQRPTSFYQAAVETIYSPNSHLRHQPRPRPKKNPRRSSFPSRLKKGGNLEVTPLIKKSPVPTSTNSGNESDDEGSTSDVIVLSPEPIRKDQDPPRKLSRSKTWANLAVSSEVQQDELMWLWGSIGYGLNATGDNNSLDVDDSPIPAPQSLTNSNQHSRASSHSSHPRLITNLTSNVRRFDSPTFTSHSSTDAIVTKKQHSPSHLNDTITKKLHDSPALNSHNLSDATVQKRHEPPALNSHKSSDAVEQRRQEPPALNSHKSTDAVVQRHHDVLMLNSHGSPCSVPITCRGNPLEELRDIIEQEKKLMAEMDPDATYPANDHLLEKDGVEPQLPRVDYSLQAKVMSNLSFEYLVGLGAHFCYWNNRDVANIILERLKALPQPSHALKRSVSADEVSSSPITPSGSQEDVIVTRVRYNTLPRSGVMPDQRQQPSLAATP